MGRPRIVDVAEDETEEMAKAKAKADAGAGDDGGMEVVLLPLDGVKGSPTNPRKTFRGIEELARSIRTLGQLKPIMVRFNSALNAYEIAHGERRFRARVLNAEKYGGPKTILATIAVLSDAELDDIHLQENLHHDPLTPLEEAEGFHRMQTVHRMSVEQISERYGKGTSYVYKRLQLRKLSPVAREALDDGEISLSIADEIARCPEETHGQIVEALKEMGITSFREALEYIRSNFSHDLREAPFDTSDAYLVPESGACTKCPLKPEENICASPKCYKGKLSEYQRAAQENGEAAGQKWLGPAESRRVFGGGLEISASGPYVGLDQPCFDDADKRTWRQLLGDAEIAICLATNPRGKVVEVVDKVDAVAKARGLGVIKSAATPALKSDGNGEAPAATTTKTEEELDAELALAGRVLQLGVEAALRGEHIPEFLRLMLSTMLSNPDETDRSVAERRGGVEKLRKEVSKMSERRLLGLLLELVMAQHADYMGSEMRAMARILELNLAKLEEEVKNATSGRAAMLAEADAIFEKHD